MCCTLDSEGAKKGVIRELLLCFNHITLYAIITGKKGLAKLCFGSFEHPMSQLSLWNIYLRRLVKAGVSV